MDIFVAGGQAHIALEFTKDGVLTDPTTVTVKWRIGSGAVTTLTYAGGGVIKDGTGLYHVDLTVSTAGTYKVRVESTGTVVSADQDTFEVSESLMV